MVAPLDFWSKTFLIQVENRAVTKNWAVWSHQPLQTQLGLTENAKEKLILPTHEILKKEQLWTTRD